MDSKLLDTIIKANKIIPHEEQLELVKEWQRDRNKSVLDKLVLSNMRVVAKEAYRIKSRNLYLSHSDLLQEGVCGLLKAAEMFDTEKKVNFLTYAVWWVKAYMRSHVMSYRSVVRLGTTRSDRVLFANLSKTAIAAESKGLAGTDKEEYIAKKLDVSIESVRYMSRALKGFDMRLDAPAGSDDGDVSKAETKLNLMPDQRATDNMQRVVSENDKMSYMLEAIISNMPSEEAKILRDRWLNDEPKTLRALSREMGISREWVRNIETKAMVRLKKRLASEYNIRSI